MKKAFHGRRSLAGAVAAALLAITAGCGGGDSDGNTDADPAGARQLTIKRDSYGVPHVYADTVRGIFHGFGYAVAEDRLYQMEIAKRAVLGTGAEVLGASYLGANIANLDEGSRRLFDPASIHAQLDRLPQEERDIFDGYADGFNARIKEVLADRENLLPKQFIDAGFDPVPWTGYDVAMIWVGTMANRYSDGSSEVGNLGLRNELRTLAGNNADGDDLFDQLRWLEDVKSPTTVPRAAGYTPVQLAAAAAASAQEQEREPLPLLASLYEDVKRRLTAYTSLPARNFSDNPHMARLAPVSPSVLQADNALAAAQRGVAAPEDRPTASNLWILGPSKTSDGSTIFNNGPQFGWVNPAYVFGIGLHGAGYDVTGNTPFAHPVLLFGTNGSISWGATAGPLDVNDMYQETVRQTADGYEYFYKGGYVPMTKRTEVIKVKGEADRTVDVYTTVHGIVSAFDNANGTAYSKRRAWDGYEIESLLGWIHSMQATNWEQWLAQASRVAITINWYYADAQGNIGYVSPGRLPIRPQNQDVRLPAVGDGSMEWVGFRPFDDVPKVYNPEQGYIVNWNNQSAPGALTDGGNYTIVDRVNEFITRIEAKPTLTPADVKQLNYDTAMADVNARYFVPYIVEAAKDLPVTDPVYQAAQLLGSWNMQNTNLQKADTYAEPAATIMRAWLPLMYSALLADDLQASASRYTSAGYPSARQGGSVSPGAASKLLYNALLGGQAGVPQTVDFFNGADKFAMIRDTLGAAVTALTTQYGSSDMNTWLTPVVPHIFQRNNFLGYPQANADEELQLKTFMNRGTQNHTVTFSSAGAASLCTVAPPGQSGFVAPDGTKSPHYSDQLALYENFDCKSEHLSPAAVDANLESTKTLTY